MKTQIDRMSVGEIEYQYISHECLKLPSDTPFAIRALADNIINNARDRRDVNVGDEVLSALRDPWKYAGQALVPFHPARVVLQDYTGVALLVDLVTLGERVRELTGGAPMEPARPVQLVVDHSISVDTYGSPLALAFNTTRDYERNQERYEFFRWCEQHFDRLTVVPPGHGIVHQVNMERLATVVEEHDGWLSLDSCVGTDSHTTMINGLGVLGWGVGGLEAIAAALDEPLDIRLPEVVGVEITGTTRPGVTATDIVLTLTQILRDVGVVARFVEFYGEGLSELSVPVRSTISNMSPEFGSTSAIFPIDQRTIDYLRLTGRTEDHANLVEQYARRQGLWADSSWSPRFTTTVQLCLDDIEPSVAGPNRPHDRVPITELPASVRDIVPEPRTVSFKPDGSDHDTIGDGSVVLAAITSCTNTSNPAVMVGAGLLARHAVEAGLSVKPWIKTSLAPGSAIVTDYLNSAGLSESLDALGFYVVGYGCTTCAGNSGDLEPHVRDTIRENGLNVAGVLSGNRNFEGRINPDVRLNYLASPALVVAYALAGRVDIDLSTEALGTVDGRPIYLRDLWPSDEEIAATIEQHVRRDMFVDGYINTFRGDERWRTLNIPNGEHFTWDPDSTYLRRAPHLQLSRTAPRLDDLHGARTLVWLEDFITTDHISPAGAIPRQAAAGRYLDEHGVKIGDFNSYGSRRGNHEVMVRGTFANVRLRNQLVPGKEGGFTRFLPTGEECEIFQAAQRYAETKTPLVVFAGQRYGAGSSRDWAAKGPALLGVRAVIARSFERIHRSNLVSMGILPLEFVDDQSVESLGLDPTATIDILGVDSISVDHVPSRLTVRCGEVEFMVRPRIDTPREAAYVLAGGLIPFIASTYETTSARDADSSPTTSA